MSDRPQIVQLELGQRYEMICRRCAPTIPHQAGSLQFEIEPAAADWLVFFEPIRQPIQTSVPWSRRVLMVGEPSPLCHWPATYVNQFGHLLSPYKMAGYRGNWVESHPALPWIVGWNRASQTVMPLGDLAALQSPEKINAVSVVVSNKVVQAGHRNRLKFLDRLSATVGDQLQLFGKGIREVDDKLDAVLPYRYHLALENTIEPNYWTEKIADSFLGFAMPLYSGCPNINQWFSDDSMVRLNLDDHGAAIAKVQQILESNMYEDRLQAIIQSRQKVLHEENLFRVLTRTLERIGFSEQAACEAVIQPIPKPHWPARLRREATRVYRQLTTTVPKHA